MASLVLLTMILLTTFVMKSALGVGVTLETDKPSYTVGEPVFFSGLGYEPSGSMYEINVSDGGLVVASVSFASDESGGIPADVSWAIPFGAKNGTYGANVFNVTDPLNEKTFLNLLASARFQVLNATEALNVLEGNLTDLKGLVISDVDIMGINTSLLASLNNSARKLEAAVALLEDGKNKTAANQLRAARNMLTAFVHKVLAQSDKKIDPETALALIEKANASIVNIDSMIVSAELPLGKQLALNVERTLAKQERHLTRFMIRKGLAEASTDDEYVARVNSIEGELTRILDNVKLRKQAAEENSAGGSIADLMTLARDNEDAESAREAAQLLSDELASASQAKPGLGKHLGPLIQAARDLATDSTATAKGMGDLMSKANSQVHVGKQQGHGGGKGKDRDGNGNKGGNSNKKG